MSLSAAFSALFTKTKAEITDDLQHHSWNSVRTVLVVAFLAYLLYISHLVLTPENLKLSAVVVIAFLVCNTASKCMTIWANVQVRRLGGKDIPE